MVKDYFRFNDFVSSNEDVAVLKMPSITIAEERVESIVIPGRDGTVHQADGSFNHYEDTIECLALSNEAADAIGRHIRGSGLLTLSHDPTKSYKVFVKNAIAIEVRGGHYRKFEITFEFQPFRYSNDIQNDTKIITSNTKLYNPGNIFSQPIIDIYSTTNVTLSINGNHYGLYPSIGPATTIDSVIEEVYSGQTNRNGVFVASGYPRFEPGVNDISFTGSISKIIIKPNWRWR